MRKFALLLIILAVSYSLLGQLTPVRHKVKNGYDFWVHQPKLNDTTDTILPVIIFLHGRSLSGTTLDRVRRYGVIDAIERGREINALVIAPQCPKSSSWEAERLLNVLNWVHNQYNTDTNRVYVTGMSLGGYGTIDFIAKYPEKVAAAAALCGGGNPKNGCAMTSVPLWIMHGTHDKAVPISESKKIVNAIQECGDTSRLIFTPFQNLNHADLARVFYTKELYSWLLSHTKTDSIQPVTRSIEIPASSLKEVYKDLHHKKKYHTASTLENADSNSSSPVYYTVKKGDTLGHIAQKHGTSVSKLCQLNGIKETKILQIGMKLRVR